MSNPFSKPEKSTNSTLRNTFDLSFANNLTLDFGGLYPCFCKEVLPGDTFRIETTFGLRFMPTSFPLQSRIRADVHFFYVRNRNLWKGWQEFITNSPEAAVQKPFPTVSPKQLSNPGYAYEIAKTCELGDYLGLPTTLSGAYKNLNSVTGFAIPGSFDVVPVRLRLTTPVSDFLNGSESTSSPVDRHPGAGGNPNSRSGRPGFDGYSSLAVFRDMLGVDFYNASRYPSGEPNVYLYGLPQADAPKVSAGLVERVIPQGFYIKVKFKNAGTFISPSVVTCCHLLNEDGVVCSTGVYEPSLYGVGGDDIGYFYFPPQELGPLHTGNPYAVRFSVQNWDNASSADFDSVDAYPNPFDPTFKCSVVLEPGKSTDGVFPYPVDMSELLDMGSGTNVWSSLPVSALPFRAYESIYNAFYRDERNNPYVLDGVQVYNRYIPSTDGGVDNNPYHIRYRNWEQDFLTTALPSPQQGIAPLVGLTSTEAVFMDPDSGKRYVAKPVFSDDGETLQTVQFTEDVPGSVARSLVQVASSGISINDFRNVNSLQRYLENNLRNGLKYIDNLRMRWGVDPSYAVMDMPEFIGGVSQAVSVSQINQTADGGSSSPLGSYAGQLSCIGSSKRSVSHHCDEHGFIIGILSVVPVPVYSTLLPKFFTKTEPLDYFTPEFGHIGLQPIPMREVAPLLVANDPAIPESDVPKELSSTFGYQRPWYDYLASVDEVHGLFRTNLKDFLLHRVFDSAPVLSPQFLTIDPDSLTDVFSVSLGGNKILGQMYFDVKAKRPIPRFCTPKLE